MKKTWLVALSMDCSLNAFSYGGKVYFDKNKNGLYDNGEQLLSGVVVSDGKNVVKTNIKGEFKLPGHDRARFITVTTPSGYKPSNVHYIKIDDHVTSYDFALEKWDRVSKNGSHSFIHISDTEIRDENPIHKIWANNVRDYAQNEGVGFIMHTGDICYEGGLKAHIKLMNSQNMGVPMYYGIGNHDLVKGKYGEELYESLYGPAWYSFDYGNVHYVMTPMPGGDYLPSYREHHVYEWLKNDLSHVEEGQPIVVFNHDLLSKNNEFIVKKSDDERLVLNQEYNLKAWLYGHWHNHYVMMQGGVKTISTATLDKGGIDHSTSAFRVVNVDGKGDLDTQLRYTFIDNNIEIASIGNGFAALDKAGNVVVNVNAYLSQSPTKKVTYRVYDDSKVISSNQQLKQNSDWSWSGSFSLPKSLENREVFVEAIAEFNNGEIAKVKESFTFKPPAGKIQLEENWTNLLGNSAHTATIKNEFKAPLQINWVNNIGANIYFSSPIIADNVVYVAALDEELRGEGGVYALDALSGELLWKYNTRNSVKNTIVVESGNVFAQDGEGYLYAIHAKTGKLAWEKKLKSPTLPVVIEGLASNNGIVYAGTGKTLSAYDAKSGNQIWNNTEWAVNQGATSTISATNELLILGTQWGGMYGHEVKTGKLKWSISKEGISDRGSSPAMYGDLAYFISRNSLFILNAQTGDIITKKEFNYNLDATSTPLVTEKLIVFGTVDKGLLTLDRESLEEKWTITTLPSLVYTAPYRTFPVNTIETSPVRVGDLIVFGASDGILYGVNIETGILEWRHTLGAPVFSSIAASGNTIVVSDYSGNVYAFTTDEK